MYNKTIIKIVGVWQRNQFQRWHQGSKLNRETVQEVFESIMMTIYKNFLSFYWI